MKTVAERIKEIANIYKQLENLGLNENTCQKIKDFKTIANQYVRDGLSVSGSIKLFEIHRDMFYTLTSQEHLSSHVMLKSR